ncbi:MAG: hypothetical protein J5637_07685 [Prevotella sp.]|nr:hypothetical protein [Prevotella sp.]
MRQLSKWQTIVYLIGAVLMAAGAGCCAFLWHPRVFCWVFLVGAILFVAMQAQQRYEGNNFTIRRLRKIMLLSGACFIIAGLLMVDTYYQFLMHFMSKITYLTYFYNKWVIFVLVGAILQMYSTHRIGNELEKDIKKR